MLQLPRNLIYVSQLEGIGIETWSSPAAAHLSLPTKSFYPACFLCVCLFLGGGLLLQFNAISTVTQIKREEKKDRKK